jgi:hypothetical protein
MVGLGRLELPTSRLSGVRSNHLSYKPMSTGAPLYSRTEVWMSTKGRTGFRLRFRKEIRSPSVGAGIHGDFGKATMFPQVFAFISDKAKLSVS